MSILISVYDINWGSPPCVDPRYADANDVWVEFASNVGSGRVMLETRENPGPHGFQGTTMTVETHQHSVQDVRLLSPAEPRVPRLFPLQTPGDYQVIGEVQVIVRDSETFERTNVEVAVGTGWFTLGTDDVSKAVVEGDWLEFIAVGLTFYDEGT